MSNKFVKWLVIGLVVVGLSGCTFIPREGPLSTEIERQSEEQMYTVVDVDAEIVSILGTQGHGQLGNRFSRNGGGAANQTIGVGDELTITVFEADKGGLFSGEQGNRATFSSIIVDRDGQISIPYAGRIRVRGLRPFQVQDAIINKLKDKAIQPQATVSITNNEANTVTVSGDVNKPGLYPLSLRRRYLLDAIAVAGGTQFPAHETYVRLVRGNRSAEQLLINIIKYTRENVAISNGDRIYLSHNPRRYTVLGAVEKKAVFQFDAPQVSLLEAVANAGGLADLRADSTGLFLFRYEHVKVLDNMGVAYSNPVRGFVPTIYRVNMAHAKSYFYAQSILLNDKDSIYVANAKSVQLLKIMEIFNKITSSATDVAGIGRRL